MKKHIVMYLLALLSLWTVPAMSAPDLYVTVDGAGDMDGSSWGHAYPSASLQYAIDQVSASGGEIWVAAGTYYPTHDALGLKALDSRFATFSLRANVHLYGGFVGTETELSQRMRTDLNANNKIEGWEFANATILSGDIGGDGTPMFNAYHVVTDMNVGQGNSVLDGFTIRDGIASSGVDLSGISFNDGVGAYLSDSKYYDVVGGGVFSMNTHVRRCIITNNFAALSGGGIAIGGNALIDSCFIALNKCTAFGGGLAIIESGTMSNSTVFSNEGSKAGGVVLHAGGNVYTSHIYNNISDSVGGIMMNNGGMLIGSIINNNQASQSGAGGIGTRNGTIISCTSANNIDADNMGVAGSGFIVNSFLYDSLKIKEVPSNILKYNAIDKDIAEKLSPDDHNIGIGLVKPEFKPSEIKNATSFKGIALANDFLRLAEYRTQDWSLYDGSNAINAGTPDISTYTLPAKDIRGTDRVKYGRIDIGAYEFQSLLYVSVSGSGDGTGSSWSNAIAFAHIQSSLFIYSGELWFAAGDYELASNIEIRNGAYMFGGFEGTESSPDERKRSDLDQDGVLEPWEWTNKTVFINKTVLEINPITQKYEINYLLTANKNTLVDGITLTSTDDVYRGGVLKSENAIITNCNIINNKIQAENFTVGVYGGLIEDCYISGNKSLNRGGGLSIFNKGEARNCLITHNKADLYGGGVYIMDGKLSHSKVLFNEIDGKINVNGGGINIVSGRIDNCLIANNTSKGFSTRGGGIYVYANDSTVTVSNSTIVHNSVEGEGSVGHDMAVKCAVTMSNSIIGSPLYVQSLNLRNSISYSAIVGGYKDLGAGKNILNIVSQAELDAQFALPSPQLGVYEGEETYNWQLHPHSMLINRGNAFAQGTDSRAIDLAGAPRIIHDTLDLGAYEYKIPQPQSLPIKLTLADQLNKDSVTFSWNNTGADRYTLWVREGLSGAVRPQSGIVYHADKVFGNGALLDGWFCVYDGYSTAASVTGLMQGSSYKAMLVPSNGYAYRVYSSQAVEDDNILFFTTKREQNIQLNMPAAVAALSRFTASVTSTSGLNVVLSSPSEQTGTISIVGTSISANIPDSAVVTATQAGNSLFFPATITDTLVVIKASQDILFGEISDKIYGNEDFSPFVKASSGLEVVLTPDNDSVIQIVNNATIHIIGTGTVTLTASQAGNELFAPAATVSQTFSVAKAKQYISIGAITEKVYGSEDFSPLIKVGSGLDMKLMVSNDTVVDIIGNSSVHVKNVGQVTIWAVQEGNKYYEPASSIHQELKVVQAEQNIVFKSIADQVFGTGDFMADIQCSSGLPVTLTSSDPSVAAIDGNKIKIMGIGMVEITATQSGNNWYTPAAPVVQRFSISKNVQAISATQFIQKTYGDSDFLLDAKSSAQLPISYSSESPIVDIVGDKVHIKACGSATIVALQSGTDNVLPASTTIVINISKQEQSIDFAPLAARDYSNTSFMPMANASSGLPVVLASSDNSVARISNAGEIQIVGAGIATITASQPGNDTVAEAIPVIRDLIISKIRQELTVKNSITKLIYGNNDTVLSVTSSAGLPVFIQSSNKSVIDVDGSTLRIIGVGKVALRIYQPGTAGIAAAERIDSVEVIRAQQSILDFEQHILARVGEQPLILNASSTAGFAVKYKSMNTRVAYMEGNKLRFSSPGICKVVAYTLQSGNYEAASDTCTVIVSALNILSMPEYSTSRDTVIDLSELRLNDDAFAFKFIASKHFTVAMNGAEATIIPIRGSSCWTGTDTLWFGAKNTFVAGDSLIFGVKVSYSRHADDISMVTTDSLTGMYNIIAWQPKTGANTAQWIVCRRSQSLSQWETIDTVSATDLSYAVDRQANTNQQAYQYALVTVDSYGCESAMSAYHTTMHLKTGVSLQSMPQLWWTPYEGMDVDAYIIYRKNTATAQYDSIGSTFLCSFTDQYPNGSASYRVAVRFAQNIVTSRLKSDSGPFSQSMSNLAEAIILSTDAAELAGISLSPNPASDFTTLSLPSVPCTVSVTDAAGQQVMQIVEVSGEIVLDISKLAQAAYTVTVNAQGELFTLTLLKIDSAQ